MHAARQEIAAKPSHTSASSFCNNCANPVALSRLRRLENSAGTFLLCHLQQASAGCICLLLCLFVLASFKCGVSPATSNVKEAPTQTDAGTFAMIRQQSTAAALPQREPAQQERQRLLLHLLHSSLVR
jgi:hypothetical protein